MLSLNITLTKFIPFTSISTWIYDRLLSSFVFPSFLTLKSFCLLAIKSEIDSFGRHSMRLYLLYCLAFSSCCCLMIVYSAIYSPIMFLYGYSDLFWIGSCLITTFLLLVKKYWLISSFSWFIFFSLLTAAFKLDRRLVRLVKGSRLVI